MEKRIRIKEIKIRLPDSIHRRLKKQAEIEKRSMTRMVEIFIEKGLESDSTNFSQNEGPKERIG